MLLFSGAVIVFVAVLELVAQSASRVSSREFEARIARYHQIHRMRVALAENRTLTERFLRDPQQNLDAQVLDGLEQLTALAGNLDSAEEESLEEYFEMKATSAGIDAYSPLIRTAIQARQSGASGYYNHFARADRIATYTDGYLTRLLSAAMATGERISKEVADRAARAQTVALLGVLGAGILALGVAVAFATSITAPIRHLARSASEMAAGRLDVEPAVARTGDEVEVLARSFNSMSANIRSLVEGLREKAELERKLHEEELSLLSMGRALREAQFMNLQDQMRPHFLFNALNTIARSARVEKSVVTESLAAGLARLLRYALAPGGSFVALEQELGIAQEYLAFQKVRFGERISFTIDADPETLAFRIPRFSIQPVVENSVRHGIEPAISGGRVVVRARVRNSRLRISIMDTGMGMDFGQLQRLRTLTTKGLQSLESSAAEGGSLNPDGTTAGLGLANLRERLVYRYGNTVRIGISSVRERGTVIRISIPPCPVLANGEVHD